MKNSQKHNEEKEAPVLFGVKKKNGSGLQVPNDYFENKKLELQSIPRQYPLMQKDRKKSNVLLYSMLGVAAMLLIGLFVITTKQINHNPKHVAYNQMFDNLTAGDLKQILTEDDDVSISVWVEFNDEQSIMIMQESLEKSQRETIEVSSDDFDEFFEEEVY